MLLGAFRVRSFRFQWPSDLLTSWALEMETLILGWYVMVQTGSVLLLTAFGALQVFGTLAAPMFGVLGDRLGARAVLCAMRVTYSVFATLLTALAATGLLTPTWVFIVAALTGLVRPNEFALRTALIGETIPAGDLMGALGLSRATIDSARVAGALAGAGLSTVLGLGVAYGVVTAFYVASLGLTAGVSRGRPVPDPVTATPGMATVRTSSWRDLKDGLVHVVTTPKLLALMWLAFLVNLTAFPVTNGLLPFVARNVYRVDAAGLGWLMASFSFGALVGSMVMAVTKGTRRPEPLMLVSTVVWYALLLGFAHLPTMGAGLVALLLAGFACSVAMIAMTASLLDAGDDRFRARVMGVRQLAVYGMSLGLLGLGFLIERLGWAPTISAGCAVGLAFTLLIALRWRASVWPRRPTVPA